MYWGIKLRGLATNSNAKAAAILKKAANCPNLKANDGLQVTMLLNCISNVYR